MMPPVLPKSVCKTKRTSPLLKFPKSAFTFAIHLKSDVLDKAGGRSYSLNTVNVPETPKDMPAPEAPKALRNWLKDFYKGKAKPVNSDTNWGISVPATGLKETLNHLYRKRGSYRRDLHFRSLTAIDSMLEQAKFDRFEDVQNEKKGDKVSIFNVLVDFGENGIYNARMVVKHFGEDKNYYDHRLTKFEEVPIPRLLPEGSGRHSTSSDNTISSETEKSSGVEKNLMWRTGGREEVAEFGKFEKMWKACQLFIVFYHFHAVKSMNDKLRRGKIKYNSAKNTGKDR